MISNWFSSNEPTSVVKCRQLAGNRSILPAVHAISYLFAECVCVCVRVRQTLHLNSNQTHTDFPQQLLLIKENTRDKYLKPNDDTRHFNNIWLGFSRWLGDTLLSVK